MSLENKYNQIYTEKENAFNLGKPEPIVKDMLTYLHSGSVLEIGAGQGRNALFLAQNGFDVTAQDISSVGVEKISERAKELGVALKAEVSDIRSLEIDKNFDAFVSTYMFHHLSREEALVFIRKMQEHTNPEGLNAISLFTKDGDFYKQNPETGNFYPELGELKDLYEGWEIIEYTENTSQAFAKREDGTSMQNVAESLLARKK